MFNLAVHDHLLALGFTWFAHEAEFDDGDAENGPGVGCPPWDEYESADWRVIVDHDGHVAVSEARDLEFEAWCDEQADRAVTEEPGPGHRYREFPGQG